MFPTCALEKREKDHSTIQHDDVAVCSFSGQGWSFAHSCDVCVSRFQQLRNVIKYYNTIINYNQSQHHTAMMILVQLWASSYMQNYDNQVTMHLHQPCPLHNLQKKTPGARIHDGNNSEDWCKTFLPSTNRSWT